MARSEKMNKLKIEYLPVDSLKPYENNTREGDIVADIFGGSGTTLIACEQLNRKCRMVELDPHYCDVIVTRWETFTGKKAKKL